MSMTRVAVVVGLVLCSSACLYDGAYLVRGTVRSSTGAAPLRGAEIVTRDGTAGPPQKKVALSENGAYQTEYRFGGMGFLLFTPSDGDPYVEFAAPGHKARAVQLKARDAEPGVIRRACEVQSGVRCYGLDVVLEPETTPASVRR